MSFSIYFNEEKNQLLQVTRGVSFEEVIEAIKNKRLLDDVIHPSRPQQRMYVVKIGRYVWAVPYVINPIKREIFLKTMYPSRVLTKKFLRKK